MKTIDKICLFCKQEFKADMREHNRGNAKYCNLSCQRKHMNSLKPLKNVKCVNCDKEFQSVNTKAKYCSSNCKSKHYRILVNKTTEVSYALRYILPKFPCLNCGWDKSSRDIHHILPVTKGGKDEISNLITLCPNCHRLAHRDLLSKEELFELLEKRTISSSPKPGELDAVSVKD